VLDRVHGAVCLACAVLDHLTPLAFGSVTSGGHNRAQWARHSSRDEGLLHDDTPRSIREITKRAADENE
jgi:hypothetical protein